MQVKPTKWHLKSSCPCCDQGFPTFVACPSCSFVTVRCEEVGDTFIDPLNLPAGFMANCPICNEAVAEFAFATAEQLTVAGFKPSEYQ